MPKPIIDRIASIKERHEKLSARLAVLQSKAKQEDRKRLTRRKIVVGSAVLMAMEKDPLLAERIHAVLAQQVGRPIDRAVIADLLPASPAPPAAADRPFAVTFREAARG